MNIKLIVIAAAFAIFIVACGQTAPNNTSTENATKNAPNAPLATANPADDLAAAAQLYAENCQICHQDTGKGGKNLTIKGKKLSPADLTSDKFKKHSDQDLAKDITEGVTDEGMPSFKDKLSQDQIKQVVQYIRKLQAAPLNL